MAVFISFANTIGNGFVYDDFSVISDNPRVKKLQNLRHLFTKNYFKITNKGKQTAFGEESYRPIVTFTYFADSFLHNGSSAGCHLTNLILHLCNVALLFVILRNLFYNSLIAFLSSLVFAVHPVVCEVVNAIAFREDSLAALFLFLGLLCLILKPENGIKKIYLDIFNGLFYILALFSKEMAIVYPLLLTLIFYLKKISFRKNIMLIFIILLSTLFYLFIRFHLMANTAQTHLSYPGGGFLTNIYTMSTVVTGYIKLIFMPISLVADYQISPKRSFFDFHVVASCLVIVISFGLALYFFIRNRALTAFGVLWFFISLIPVINIIKIGNIAAERYLYLPFIGGAVLIGVLCNDLINYRKKYFLVFLLMMINIYISRSIIRNNDWANAVSLWESTIREEPKSYRAYSNLASHYFDKEDYKKAIAYYLKCLQYKNSSQDRYNLANCYKMIGQYNQAVKEYEESLEIEAGYTEVYNNFALTLIELKALQQAEDVLRRGLYYNNTDPYIIENLGFLMDIKGDYESAVKYLSKALSINPDSQSAYNKLGVTYIKKGERQKGIDILTNGAKRFPLNPFFYKNLAIAFNGTPNKELYYWEKAHTIEPQDIVIIKRIIELSGVLNMPDKISEYKYKLRRMTLNEN